MKQICDLHTHSVFSDGTYTPTEIIDKAIEIGLSAVALCDHNTVDGISEFLSSSKGKNIEVISGAEFSVEYKGIELHLLGLFITEETLPKVTDLVKEVNKRKAESNIQLINALNESGYKINYSDIASKTPNGQINRAHIARELTEKGYTKSISHAFDTILAKGAGYYIEPKRLTVFEMIEWLNSIGAVPVLAHPFLNLSEEELVEFLPIAKECGLVGMECYYSLYSDELVNKSIELANRFGLKRSGGSDFHGANKPDIKLGFGIDNLSIPYELAKALKP